MATRCPCTEANTKNLTFRGTLSNVIFSIRPAAKGGRHRRFEFAFIGSSFFIPIFDLPLCHRVHNNGSASARRERRFASPIRFQ